MGTHILVIDQGTTSSRAIVFDANQQIAGMGRMEFTQQVPQPGWVEHVPEEIWATCLWAMKTALRRAGIAARDLAAVSITNQRETTIVWEKNTGRPIYNAIVWQDRRTTPICDKLKAAGAEPLIAKKTGLLLDAYFSGPKIKWILDHVKGARRRARRGELLFGTIDSYLIWRLTGGRVHATDATNASRTLIYNIRDNRWDEDLLDLFDIPAALLPEVKDCADDFGATEADILGAVVPIRGVAGDQQAAMIGQACFDVGMMKATYGTSCFALLNTGDHLVRSRNRLLSTIAYRLDGKTTYALEGAIFIVGGSVQWLRDEIGMLETSAESGQLAEESDPQSRVFMVPAFNGLGAPWWDDEARGAIYGLTRQTRRPELARAALEAVGYQTADMLAAMRKDWKGARAEIVWRVDGGMVESDFTMQFLADILGHAVERPPLLETTALGAAWLSGHTVGLWPGRDEFARHWAVERQFLPQMDAPTRREKLAGWQDAVRRTLTSPGIRHRPGNEQA